MDRARSVATSCRRRQRARRRGGRVLRLPYYGRVTFEGVEKGRTDKAITCAFEATFTEDDDGNGNRHRRRRVQRGA